MKHNLSYQPIFPSVKLVRVKGIINDLSLVIIWRCHGWILKLWERKGFKSASLPGSTVEGEGSWVGLKDGMGLIDMVQKRLSFLLEKVNSTSDWSRYYDEYVYVRDLCAFYRNTGGSL